MSTHQIDISDFERDARLFLFTSLTAGSSHIITATSRLETILKANKIPFQAIDLATDEKARRLWQRRARERKLPGLVKEGFVIGDLNEVEEWNEFGELKENIGPVPAPGAAAAANTVKSGVNIAPPIPVNPTATQGTTKLSTPPVGPRPGVDESKFRALPGAAEVAARNTKPAAPSPEQAEGKSPLDDNKDENARPVAESMTSAPAEKAGSITAARKLGAAEEVQRRGVEHLSAPPSGIATPRDGGGDGEEEKLTHRGSEVLEAPSEEIEKVESENSLVEAAEEGGAGEKDAAGEKADGTGVEATDAGEGKAAEEIKEQSATESADAGKSVGD